MSVVPQVARATAILSDALVLFFTWKGTALARKAQRDDTHRMSVGAMILRDGT